VERQTLRKAARLGRGNEGRLDLSKSIHDDDFEVSIRDDFPAAVDGSIPHVPHRVARNFRVIITDENPPHADENPPQKEETF